ncbi:hypothetical protein EH138_20305 [Salmonella enterica subsp. enterica serovar Eastbourne]|uniref:Transmembrane protein n=1 Tax=Salmonella enterica subsp. enterica serovar Eastbourne TaxID=486993 RepID=A0A702FAP7_SALET|nr:hypothetical protein [Salmonella enterica subsp. enterica serovar Eastbourne]ECA1898061.1 hypothetical protein [Salmonella enterica subsp. enterica serovar Eastbourne]HAC6674868.1 hypothetical protein [Salmonella enterica subsp. enterica serovar Eastbourne]HAE5115416.1 hypothetical protein [Salmonella enterica subsp. enterica serovar Eastbourne]HAE8026519.1 hypothetical protein [Salmonella enterica subsp. enterica serovar Eastbourne]
MNLNSNGDKNRIAGRDYKENNVQIDSLDSSQTININVPVKGTEERPLVKSQRISIGKLVYAIAESENSEAAPIWVKLHAELGVNGVSEISGSQYKAALKFLNDLLADSKEKKTKKILVAKILNRTEDQELRHKLNEHCSIYYKNSRLDELSHNQLVEIYEWVEKTVSVVLPDYKEYMPVSFDNKIRTNNPVIRTSFIELLTTHFLVFVIVFVAGFVVGEIVSKI